MAGVAGTFERKQLLSPSRIVRWSHSRRFEMGRRVVQRLGGERLLDYGCGDGTFLKRVHDLVEECVGTDRFIADFPRPANVRLVPTSELEGSHARHYDLVFCMEVLEHCLQPEVEVVLDNLQRLVSSRGAVVISVPVEIGPTLLGKHVVRRILGMRNVGDYKYTEPYPVRDLVRMVLADDDTSIERPVYGEGPARWHPHMGFNWRALRQRIELRFTIEETTFTPLSWTRGLASSQVWFVARPRG